MIWDVFGEAVEIWREVVVGWEGWEILLTKTSDESSHLQYLALSLQIDIIFL